MEHQEELFKFRCRFEKTGPLRFISHLDLTRAFHRAFLRAGLSLKFSEGFSPHPKFSLALPLSVGTESLTELADFSLTPQDGITKDVLADRLQAQMPAGIRILAIEEQGEKFSEIFYASYTVFLPKADPALASAIQTIDRNSLKITKKNKKGKTVEKELAQGIQSLLATQKDGGIQIETVLCVSGENYLKPESLLEALQARIPSLNPLGKRICRTQIFRENMTRF